MMSSDSVDSLLQKAAQYFRRNGAGKKSTGSAATSNMDVPLYTEHHLFQQRFADLLMAHGLPQEFSDFMLKNNCVISGSAALEFLDHARAQDWIDAGEGVHDLDLYVPKGKVPLVLAFLEGSAGLVFNVIAPAGADGDSAAPGTYSYSRSGIEKVLKLVLSKGGLDYKLDIVESIAPSALLPIVLFNFSHCRNALSPNGLLVFHPEWTFNNITYVESRQPLGVEVPVSKTLAKALAKHEKRGFTVANGREPELKHHACGEATCCLWTLRHTEDAGTLFILFNLLAKSVGKTSVGGTNMTCIWRQGGWGCKVPIIFKGPCGFYAPGLTSGAVDASDSGSFSEV